MLNRTFDIVSFKILSNVIASFQIGMVFLEHRLRRMADWL